MSRLVVGHPWALWFVQACALLYLDIHHAIQTCPLETLMSPHFSELVFGNLRTQTCLIQTSRRLTDDRVFIISHFVTILPPN